MKLKTKIIHSFEIEDDIMDNVDFSFETPIKKKIKIIEVKKIKKNKKDVSTGLF